MAIDSRQFQDAEFAAQYFSDAGDANAAQRKLSEDGATVNLMEVVLCLAKKVQELKGVGTPEGDEQLLSDENTPESQKDAIQRGMDLQQKSESENAPPAPEANDANIPPASEQSSDSSVNLSI